MNTPDTERAIDVQRYHLGLAFKSILASENPEESFVEYISSRDTYWKEQMEKGVLKGERRRIIEQIREEVRKENKKYLYEHIEEYVARRIRLNIPVTVNRLLEHMQTMLVQPTTPITNEDNLK